MENGGFELQEEGMSTSNLHKNHKITYAAPSQDKKSSCSLMRIFLVCFLACLITTAIGVLILSLVYVGHFDEKGSGDAMNPGTSMNPPKKETEARFSFMNRLGKSKEYTFQGGAIQWARFRNNPQEYSSEGEMSFGNSINSHESKMTAATLRIVKNGLRAPHWHFNANEHGFLLQIPEYKETSVDLLPKYLRIDDRLEKYQSYQGKAWIGVVDDGANTVTTFNVTLGQVIFFPKNTLHWVKSVGDEDCLFLLFFTTHDELKTLDVDDAFFKTPEDIASRSLKPEGGVQFIRTFVNPAVDQAINLPPNLMELIQNASFIQSEDALAWQYFYDLIGSRQYVFPGGIIQWARYRKNGAGLNDKEKVYSESIHSHEDTLTLATLRIYSNGLRQPHFHFNAHEMGYVISGCGAIGIVGDEPLEEFAVDVGDVFFFPIGTQHYIKSTCLEDLYMILAFNTGNQLETLDMDDYFHATADHILAQLFNKKQSEFKKIPRFAEDQAVNIP